MTAADYDLMFPEFRDVPTPPEPIERRDSATVFSIVARLPKLAALAPYRDAGLMSDLIPLHRWDARDADGKERGKSPEDGGWRRREYQSQQIENHFRSGKNVGFRIPDRWIVFDLDPRNVPEGRDVVAEFEAMYGVNLADYPRVRTGSGGLHAYGRVPLGTRVRNAIDTLPGIEFKALGRQVVTPGSIHPCGEYYEWIDGPALKDAPAWPAAMLDAIRKVAIVRDAASASAADTIPVERAVELLRKLDPTEFQDHDRWLDLMMAFHSGTGGAAADEFIEWSTGDPAYADHGEIIRQRWDSLRPDGGTTIGTFYKKLLDAGTRSPRRRRRCSTWSSSPPPRSSHI